MEGSTGALISIQLRLNSCIASDDRLANAERGIIVVVLVSSCTGVNTADSRYLISSSVNPTNFWKDFENFRSRSEVEFTTNATLSAVSKNGTFEAVNKSAIPTIWHGATSSGSGEALKGVNSLRGFKYNENV